MTTIGLIRHGITDWNIDRRAQGQTDIPLNETGIMQAERLGRRLKDDNWSIIYSSDLSRARATAAILSSCTGLEVRTDARLRERSFGEIEGTTVSERIEKWGPDWQTLDLGMEDKDAVIKRGTSLIQEIEQEFPDKKILIVSHIAFIRIMLNELDPGADKDGHLENTSLTIVKRSGDRWKCELYNNSEHLNESMSDGKAHI